jgi:hypothetical protein
MLFEDYLEAVVGGGVVGAWSCQHRQMTCAQARAMALPTAAARPRGRRDGSTASRWVDTGVAALLAGLTEVGRHG